MSQPPADAVPAPRRRTRRWLLAILLAIATLAAYGVYSYIAGQRRLQAVLDRLDREDPGWRLEDLQAARRPIPDEENSALVLEEAIRLAPTARLVNERLYDVFHEIPPGRQLSSDQATTLRAELSGLAPALAEARKLASLPRGCRPEPWVLDWEAKANRRVGVARYVLVLLTFDAMLRGQDGDADGALASAQACLNGSRSSGEEPALISQLVRAAFGRLATGSIERVLAQSSPSCDSLAALQTLLEDEASQPLFQVGMRGMRAISAKTFQAVRSGRLSAADAFGPLPPVIGLHIGPFDLDRVIGQVRIAAGDHATAMEYLTRQVEITRLPDDEQMARFQELDDELSRQPALAHLVSPSRRLTEVFIQWRATLRCAVCGLALERYRRDHGRWPQTLAALSPEYLKQVPADPFNGRPLSFARVPAGVAVYSLLPDGTDRKGRCQPGPFSTNEAGKALNVGFRLWDPERRRRPAPPRPES